LAVIGAVGAALNGILHHFRHSRRTYAAADRSFGMRIRSYAAAVRTKNHSTKSRPRCRVLRRPPVVLIQPNGLFDPLSLDHADGIARMPSGARVDRRRRRLAARADRDPQEHPEVAAARQACEHRVQRALHCGWRDRLPSGLARSVARALSRSGWDPVPLRPRGLLALAVFSNRRLDPWLVALRHSRFPLSISLWRNAFNSRAGISGPHSGGFMTKRETQIILKTERMSRFRSSRSGSPPRCT
jgi:hypothetical protein